MRYIISILTLLVIGATANAATLKVGTVANIKGQEPTVIRGIGLVTGLKGTGDNPANFKETARTLGRIFKLNGHPGVDDKELATSKSVAIVSVTATIPGEGARDGEEIDCVVTTLGDAKSLKDGYLSYADLIGAVPQGPEREIIMASAWGKITLEDPTATNAAKVVKGARLTADFRNPYVKDGCITLVLDRNYSQGRFSLANSIADAINKDPDVNSNVLDATPTTQRNNRRQAANDEAIAFALDAKNVVVKVPDWYITNPAEFVSLIENVKLEGIEKVPTIGINSRTGVLSIDPTVEISPVSISHKSITVQAGPGVNPPAPGQPQPAPPQRFVDFDVESRITGQQNVRLSELTNALNAMKLPPQDVIEIIRVLEKQGNLNGEIVESK
ncbi:MAG: flagellar basal body P-ring protein FlgI [Thermoguttaceae bacterium]